MSCNALTQNNAPRWDLVLAILKTVVS